MKHKRATQSHENSEIPTKRVKCEAEISPVLPDHGSDRSMCIPMGGNFPPLPIIEGPKMKPFANGDLNILFQGSIGEQGVHSNVFKVIIDSKPYALKLFKTWSVSFAPDADAWSDTDTPDDIMRRQYYAPFNNECRAYGRIQEKRVTERFWKCYGYIIIPSQLREQLYKVTNYDNTRWEVRMSERVPLSAEQLRWPIFGLLKELGPSNALNVNPKLRSVRLMLGDLRTLHKIGILNNDIGSRNYIEGRIVDFSSAVTMPHIRSLIRKRSNLESAKIIELAAFDGTIRELEIKTKVSALSRRNKCKYKTRAARRRRLAIPPIDSRPISISPLYEIGVRVPERSGTYLINWEARDREAFEANDSTELEVL